MRLTNKQDLFCREYMVDMVGSAAAARAGYSKKAAAQIAANLLGMPKIQERIAELRADRNEQVGIDAYWVLQKAKDAFDFNAQHVFDNEGNPKMVNASAAGKFLELCGKHVDVKAWDREKEPQQQEPQDIVINIVDAVRQDGD